MGNMTPIQLARSRMMMRHPFFASLLVATECIECEVLNGQPLPTAATDMVRIYYNPKFMASLHKDVAMFVLAHEVMHIMLKHGLRRGSRDPELFNIACDFVINRILRAHKFTLWDKCYVDQWQGKRVDFGDKGAEEVYAWLLENGGAEGDSDGDQGGMGRDVMEPRGMDQAEKSTLERKINARVAQAAQAAHMSGQLSQQMAQIVHGILNPPLSWQELLREFATRLTAADENWSHRNRRFQHIYLPRHLSVSMGELVGIGDTSGSLIGSSIFAQTGEEIATIREQVKPERVRWIWADDDECVHQQVFEPEEEVKLEPRGGGGTDLRKPLKFVEQYDPIVVILVTDGYTPWPEVATPFPLIILCNTNAACPEWATTIRIKGD